MTAWKGYPNFAESEFRCKCGCGRADMDPYFMAILQAIRTELGFPMPINSGYRCPEHNAQESESGTTGPHTTGKAADISANSERAFLIIAAALRQGIKRFGVGDGFVHIDISDTHPSPRAWNY